MLDRLKKRGCLTFIEHECTKKERYDQLISNYKNVLDVETKYINNSGSFKETVKQLKAIFD